MHKVLLDYLITDEKKHDGLLGQLDEIKVGMSRSSGAEPTHATPALGPPPHQFKL